MPTIIGVIFFCCAAYCFVLRQDRLFGLLIIASVFQAASAINIGERGIQPYYVVAVFIIARAVMNRSLGAPVKARMPQASWLLLFGAIAIASAFVLPFIFSGIPVYDPKIGIDDSLIIHPPLHFGLNNLAQAGFLACHIATAFAILAIGGSSKKARKAYIWAFSIVALVVAAQSVCQLTGIPFPNTLILNNPGYSLWDAGSEVNGTRNPGTFAEPSFAGSFLVMYCVGFLAEYLSGAGRALPLIASLLASGLVASSGSLFTLCLLAPLLLIRYFPLRLPWHVNLKRIKRVSWVLLLTFAPAALALFASSGYRDALITNTLSKTDSGSFFNRIAADLFALQLLPRTYWLGVGLGSNRASSLLPTLLSNVGIAGIVVFAVFCLKLFVKLPKEYGWLKWAALALFLNMCISVADVTMPTLWLPILLAIQFSSKNMNIPNKATLTFSRRYSIFEGLTPHRTSRDVSDSRIASGRL
jgi:hypothetical protein